MAYECKSRLKYGGDDNYHIFLNSVEGISRIIRLAGLTPDICRVVCSQSETSIERNQEKLPDGFPIQTTNDDVKLFNFYTSTCFEGQDILDPVGRTFIVSEKYKNHTKMDIMTTLLQICGRVRNSKYRTEIVQYYSTSKYTGVSLEEFTETLNAQLEEAKQNASILNMTTGSTRDRIIKEIVNKEPYIDYDEKAGEIIVDENLAKLEIVNYGIINGQYKTKCNMIKSLETAGLNVTTGKDPVLLNEYEEMTTVSKTSFKDAFEEYADIKSKGPLNLCCFRADRIAAVKPLVKEAYEKLGVEKVRQLKYHQSNIKRELIKMMHETADVKAFMSFDQKVEKGVPIPKSWIKQELGKIFKELHLN